MNPGATTEWKKPDRKEYILFDSISMNEQNNSMMKKKNQNSGCFWWNK